MNHNFPPLVDPAKKLHDSALTHITRGGGVTGFSLRTERWRYIEWSDGNAELYDHDHDPVNGATLPPPPRTRLRSPT